MNRKSLRFLLPPKISLPLFNLNTHNSLIACIDHIQEQGWERQMIENNSFLRHHLKSDLYFKTPILSSWKAWKKFLLLSSCQSTFLLRLSFSFLKEKYKSGFRYLVRSESWPQVSLSMNANYGCLSVVWLKLQEFKKNALRQLTKLQNG